MKKDNIIHIFSNGKEIFDNVISSIIAMLSVLLSFSLFFFPFFEITLNYYVSLLTATIVLILCIAFQKTGYVKLIISLIVFIVAIVKFKYFSGGLQVFMNNIVYLLNVSYNFQLSQFTIGTDNPSELLFFTLLFCTSSIIIHSITTYKYYNLLGCILFFIAIFFMLLRIKMNILAIMFTCESLIICFLLGEGHSGFHNSYIVIIFSLTALIAFIITSLFSGYSGSYSVDEFRNSIKSTVHNTRYGKDTFPDGNLKKAYLMNDTNHTMLSIDMSTSDELYLGGFIGADYSNGKWSEYNNETFSDDWKGMFKWLNSLDFNAHYIYSDNHKNDNKILVTVKNINSDRSVLYVPFCLSSIKSGKYHINNDLKFNSNGVFGAKTYSFEQLEYPNIENELINYIDDNTAFQPTTDAITVYDAFVNDIYTKISDSDKAFLNDTFFNTEYLEESNGLYSIISRIRTVLELRTKYTSTPPAYTGNENFSEWFLNTSKQGNSSYYATLGALALRTAGFPARYIEGYHSLKTDKTHVDLSAQDAHSWVEVYLLNYGWIPIEFSPGFYNQSLLTEQTVEISSDSASGASDQESPYSLSETLQEDKKQSNNEDKKSAIFKAIYILIAVVVILLLILSAIILRYFLILRHRKKLFSSSSPERYIYAYIFDLLQLGGIKCDSSKPLNCINDITKRFKGVRTEEYKRVVELMQKTVFGETSLKKHEIRTLRLFYSKIRKRLYHTSKPLKQVILKFIYVV